MSKSYKKLHLDYVKTEDAYNNHIFKDHVKVVYKRYWDAGLVNTPRFREYEKFTVKEKSIYFYFSGNGLEIPINVFTDTNNVFKTIDELNIVKKAVNKLLDGVGRVDE